MNRPVGSLKNGEYNHSQSLREAKPKRIAKSSKNVQGSYPSRKAWEQAKGSNESSSKNDTKYTRRTFGIDSNKGYNIYKDNHKIEDDEEFKHPTSNSVYGGSSDYANSNGLQSQ